MYIRKQEYQMNHDQLQIIEVNSSVMSSIKLVSCDRLMPNSKRSFYEHES